MQHPLTPGCRSCSGVLDVNEFVRYVRIMESVHGLEEAHVASPRAGVPTAHGPISPHALGFVTHGAFDSDMQQ